MTDSIKKLIERNYNISDIAGHFNNSHDFPANKYAVYYEIGNTPVDTSGAIIRILGLTIALCVEGEAEIGIGGRKYKIRKNTLVGFSPKEYVHSVAMDSSVKLRVVACNLETIQTIMHKLSGFLPLMLHNPMETVMELSEEAFEIINDHFDHIAKQLKGRESAWKQLKITSLLQALLCEIMEQHYMLSDGEEKPRTRKEEIVGMFFLEVLQNFQQERRVAFYADRLCVTPKHLSAVTKEITGMTAGELIDHYVIMEAKIMLKETSLTVQEITNRLNFANQSFFGKYFKHLSGYSPSDFRKMAHSR